MITGGLSGHSSPVSCVALSRDNSYVVSGDMDGTIIAHSTKTGIEAYRADNVFANGVYGLCCLLDGSLVACGDDVSGGPNLKVFSPFLELLQTLVGHNGTVWCVTVTPSGSHFASCGGDDLVGAGGGTSGRECKCLRITRVVFLQCASPPTASSWLLEVATSPSRPTASTREVPS